MSFDLYTEQGKWREWDRLFDKVMALANRADEDWSHKSALDIGCATGWSTRALAKRFARVHGVDADKNLIDRAKLSGNYIPEGKRMSFDHIEDLSTFDAFGEQFDFVFSGYTLAYMGDVTKTLKKWASLVKPGGLLVVLEIQGLFAIHHPLNGFRTWFEKFDKDGLKSFGYSSDAGTTMKVSIENVSDLRVVSCTDWRDAELSFDGPLIPGSSVWQGWEERWKRLWPLMNQFGNVEEGLHDAFFSCLANPEHRCEKPPQLLICAKNASPKLVLSEIPRDNDHDNDLADSFFPGESGGGDGN